MVQGGVRLQAGHRHEPRSCLHGWQHRKRDDCHDADLCEPLPRRIGRSQPIDARSRPREQPAFYWVYMNRSRVGRLAGLIGSMSRPIVQRRARSGLMKSLTQTKQRFEAAR